METYQQNKLTMLQTVLLYLAGAGAALAAIVRIGKGRDVLAGLVANIVAAGGAQEKPTTGVTRTREEVKAVATAKGEVLRLLVVTLTADETLAAELETPVSKVAKGKDADFVKYLQGIAVGIGTLKAKDLEESGYDGEVLTGLTTDIKALTDTQGAARQIQLGTTTATEELPELFEKVDLLLEKTLDPLVKAQKLSKPKLVEEYQKARRIIHTAAKRRARFSGPALPRAVTLVLDRREAGLVDPVLANRSGRGRNLRYYTAASATAAPLPGQGVVVKNRAEVHLDNYDKLGPDINAPFLLVVLEGIDGEGHWLVK